MHGLLVLCCSETCRAEQKTPESDGRKRAARVETPAQMAAESESAGRKRSAPRASRPQAQRRRIAALPVLPSVGQSQSVLETTGQPESLIVGRSGTDQVQQQQEAALPVPVSRAQVSTRVCYTLSRRRTGSDELLRLGFVMAPRNVTFSGLRTMIQNEIDQALLPPNEAWRFFFPMGAMSANQESSSATGPVASFLETIADGELGDGSFANPFRLCLLI